MKFPKKEKSVTLLWVILNLTLLVKSGNLYFEWRDWYPVNHYVRSGGGINTNITLTKINFDPFWSYDLSEFFIYSSVPVLIFIFYNLIRKKIIHSNRL